TAGAPKPPARQDDAVSRRLIWTFVLGVALSLAALIASNDQDAIANLLSHDTGSLALKLALAIFVGGLVITLYRERLSKALEALLFWGRARPAAVGRLQLPFRIARRRRPGDRGIDAGPRRQPRPPRRSRARSRRRFRGRGAYQRRARADGARHRRQLRGAHTGSGQSGRPAARSARL